MTPAARSALVDPLEKLPTCRNEAEREAYRRETGMCMYLSAHEHTHEHTYADTKPNVVSSLRKEVRLPRDALDQTWSRGLYTGPTRLQKLTCSPYPVR